MSYPIQEIIGYMIGDRLRELRMGAGMTQPEFASIAGTSKQFVGRLEKGRNKDPNPKFIALWARHFSVRMEWITTGRGPKEMPQAPRVQADDPWRDVKGYSQQVGLSDGAEADEYAETHSLKFRADSLARKRLKPRDLAVFYGQGDSMEPRIRSGDVVLFDQTDTRPRDGYLFVILVPGAGASAYSVKRCELIDDLVLFKADNPKGDHGWTKARRMDDPKRPIEIIGRVRWIGSWEG